ncbi:MAG: TonB-dependent receptor [Candidatus Latescibacteria bacterium]|nr:TonB-dependent receptor [Candidatus Latescibacterota bacterium]
MEKSVHRLGLFFLLGLSPLHAQEETADTTYAVESVLVEAPRTQRRIEQVPYAVGVVGGDVVQVGQVGLSLEESLRQVPGIMVHNRSNFSQGDRITIRGSGSRAAFGVRGIKLVLDGIPLTMPDGQAQLNNIDLGSIGRIEVVRGPSSSLYGNAGGGLIHLQTEAATPQEWRFEPRLVLGADGLRKWQGKLSGGNERHRFLVNMNRLQADGYRDHAWARSVGVNAVGQHQLGRQVRLQTVFNLYDAPYLFNPSSLDRTAALANPRQVRGFVQRQGASKQVQQMQGGATLIYQGDSGLRAETTLYGLRRDLLNPIPGRIVDVERSGGGLRTVISGVGTPGGQQLLWTVGGDVELQRDQRAEFANEGLASELVQQLDDEEVFDALGYGDGLQEQEEEVIALGPFLQVEWALARRWSAVASGRYDHFRFDVADRFFDDGADDSGRRTMDQFSPALGLIFRPQTDLQLYANYATSFQTPTTTELGNRTDGAGGFNPQLEAERSRSGEVGAKGHQRDWAMAWETALYWVDIVDMLIPYQVEGSEEIFFRNAGQARNKGIEVQGSWSPRRYWEAAAAYTWSAFEFEDFRVEGQDGEFVQLKGNEVPGVPSGHFFAQFQYRRPEGGFAQVQAQWVDQYFGNDFNGPKPGSDKPLADFVNDAYFKVDLRGGWSRQVGAVAVELFGGVDNLFDQEYNGSIVPNALADRFFEPAPGRSWYLGCQAGWAAGS